VRWTPLLAAGLLTACSSGSSSPPVTPRQPVREVAFCRARLDRQHLQSELWSATTQALDLRLVAGGNGVERGARVSPDGTRVAFTRELDGNDPRSRELFVATLADPPEQVRLTADRFRDDAPCWAPDGASLLFVSDRGGRPALWRIGADGQGLAAVTGSDDADDADPDWRGTRIVFSRAREGTTRLFAMQDTGAGLVPLTDGTGNDVEPAWSPDGNKVLFVRRGGSSALLMALDVPSGAVTRLDTSAAAVAGEDRWPRWSPRGDRIFVARSRPALGMPGLRLTQLDATGGDALLLLPDERYEYQGFDAFPGLAPWEAPGEPRPAGIDEGGFRILLGVRVDGAPASILARDGAALAIRSERSDDRDVAAIWTRWELPITNAADVGAVHVSVTAALGALAPGRLLRIAVYNAVEERFDTIVELEPADTALRTYAFATRSLQHVDNDRRVRVEVIGDGPLGQRFDLNVDHVGVSLRR
jgi:dipeptidyl aminopeptidase/acylaminoacyl peptidase